MDFYTDSGNDLALINQLAKTELSAGQVYTFTVRLCDNEVDRDFERFHGDSLEELGRLFVGKCGIFDHQWSASGQTARIYRTEVVQDPAALTAAGDPYCWLKGWAYLLRSEKNAGLIDEIEGGIKKEVSVSCSMARSVCSICGAENGSCAHVKGQSYQGRLCFLELRDPLDAYEWSFVAVPAQRNAGILKRFRWGDRAGNGGSAGLCKEAELGRKYLSGLRREVLRLAMLAQEGLDGCVFQKAVDRLEEPELLELKRCFEKQTARQFPPFPQLRDWNGNLSAEDGADFLV